MFEQIITDDENILFPFALYKARQTLCLSELRMSYLIKHFLLFKNRENRKFLKLYNYCQN